MKYDRKMQTNTRRPGTAKPSSRALPHHSSPKQKKKLSRDELVQANTRRHRNRHKKNYILYYILLLLLVLGTGITLSLTVFFHIEQFDVQGCVGTPDAQQVILDSGIELGENLFRVSTDRAERAIMEHNITLDGVKITRVLPSTMRITVEPAEIAAVVGTDGQYYSMSRGGRIVRISEQVDESEVPLVFGCDFSKEQLGAYVLPNNENKLETLMTILDAIEKNEAGGKIGCIDLESVAIARLYYGNHTEIKFDGVSNLEFELSRVLELFKQGRVSADEYQIIDATTAAENAHYFVLPLDSSPLPSKFSAAVSDEEKAATLGHDLPPDQLPPDLVDEPEEENAAASE